MHTMILGTSTYGKSYLSKDKARRAKKQGLGVLVLDPFLSTGWNADYITDDWEKFLQVAKRNRRCQIYIEECSDMLGVAGSNQFKQMRWLGSQASHLEHHVHFIAQYYTMIPPHVRINCTQGFIFHQKTEDACSLLVKEFAGNPQLANCYKLPKYHFYAVGYPHLDASKVYTLDLSKI